MDRGGLIMFTDEQRKQFETLNSKAAKHKLKMQKAENKASELFFSAHPHLKVGEIPKHRYLFQIIYSSYHAGGKRTDDANDFKEWVEKYEKDVIVNWAFYYDLYANIAYIPANCTSEQAISRLCELGVINHDIKPKLEFV